MLYTRKGDGGTSGLFGTTVRLPKDSPIYEALGTLDELTSLLGFCRACASRKEFGSEIASEILTIQQCLCIIQAEVAGSQKKIDREQVLLLEQTIDRFEAQIENPHAFIIPGSTELSGLLDYARAVSRRAERAVTAVAIERGVSDHTRSYLNRLSSLMYVLARYSAVREEAAELAPSY